MTHPERSHILSVDDDLLVQRIVEKVLKSKGYQVSSARNAGEALEQIHRHKPDLILLDVLMPGMNGYEFFAVLQKNPETAYIPVIFLTSLDGEMERANAFSVGPADYLIKPVDKTLLLQKVHSHLQMNTRWQDLPRDFEGLTKGMALSRFTEFKETLVQEFHLSPQEGEKIASLGPFQIYSVSSEMGIANKQIAMRMAEFFHLPYLPRIGWEDVLGILPAAFCKKYSVVPIKGKQSQFAFVLSNPFNWELTDSMRKFICPASSPEILVTERENIEFLFHGDGEEKIQKAQ